jgi:hypothetical protein
MKLEHIQEAILTLTAEIKELKYKIRKLEGKGLPSFEELRHRGIEPSYIPSEPVVTFEGGE